MTNTQFDPARSLDAVAVDPGSVAGFGFNLYGPGTLNGGTTQSVISAGNNVEPVPPDQPNTLYDQTFDSLEEVYSAFAAKVTAGYSGLAFSGEFAATYGHQSSSTSSVVWGLYELAVLTQVLKLENSGRDNWAPGFAADADVASLPDTFDPAHPEIFFRVFERFGTHVVTTISLGGRLRSYTTATLSSSMSSTQASANIKLEYNAVFADAEAQSETDWNTLGEDWSNYRTADVTALGGSPEGIAGFVMTQGATAADAVKAWTDSVPANPMVAGFAVQPLSSVFDGAVQDAVGDAIEAYLGGMVRVSAAADPALATVALPTKAPAYITKWANTTSTVALWMWILLLDPAAPTDLGAALLNKAYYYVLPGASDTIAADINAALAKNPDPLVVVCGLFVPGGQVPVVNELNILLNRCGFNFASYLSNPGNLDAEAFVIVGNANGQNPCIVTQSAAQMTSGIPDSAPVSAVVFLTPTPLVAIEQTGTVVSGA